MCELFRANFIRRLSCANVRRESVVRHTDQKRLYELYGPAVCAACSVGLFGRSVCAASSVLNWLCQCSNVRLCESIASRSYLMCFCGERDAA